MSKSEEMAGLRAEAEGIRADACHPDSAVVWGEGDLDALLMIVGEAPGARENALGRPFVGPTGLFLDPELQAAGIQRERAYVTATVKCRPVRAGASANRAPTTQEQSVWHAVLLREIEIVSPRLILCLGSIAASALIHPDFVMSAERGQWSEGPFRTLVMATYHPAYVRRFGRLRDGQALRQFREDLRAVAEAIST